MSYHYMSPNGLDLHVKDRIPAADAARQSATAREILIRLEKQPGLILADEVGMGKTFVALAVAASVALDPQTKSPIVIMVPSSVLAKWIRDFEVFKQYCLTPELGTQFRHAVAEDGVSYLRKLDDNAERRVSVVFMTHGAMSRRLADAWVEIAILQAALDGHPKRDVLLGALAKFASRILRKQFLDNCDETLWGRLLSTNPATWQATLDAVLVLTKHGAIGDDPVPEIVLKVLRSPEAKVLLADVRKLLENIPQRESKNVDKYIGKLRRELVGTIRELWRRILSKMSAQLPLLIMDEAHHLKNPETELASLFDSEEAQEDADQVASGPLANMFERMLFLTATPFQLGHHELLNILSRFDGINWTKDDRCPQIKRPEFQVVRKALEDALDAAQRAGLNLSKDWGRLSDSDLVLDEKLFADVESWWEALQSAGALSEQLALLKARVGEAGERFRAAEAALAPWIIRHSRPATLPECGIPRRVRSTGGRVRDPTMPEGAGLSVVGDATLPFLLAGRLAVMRPDRRPVFAEGLASSYRAFLETRIGSSGLDEDHAEVDEHPRAEWYQSQIRASLNGSVGNEPRHPKLDTTVDLAMDLWEKGEKVLIFCHYIATGRALRAALSERMLAHVAKLASERLGLPNDAAMERLEKLRALLDSDEPAGRACQQIVSQILADSPELKGREDALIDVSLRFIRTPGFVVRFFDLSDATITPSTAIAAFDKPDASGMTLRAVLGSFFKFLSQRVDTVQSDGDDNDEAQGVSERQQYIDALLSIQTGSHLGREVEQTFQEEERVDAGTEPIVANVRLVNGKSKSETRQRYMLAFNTPFFPDILITSNVLAEGVDLHLNCRHVIHHDLSWNPSTLEQRTGRVDRLGAKAERARQSICVYLPYIAATQDEKMFRVVMDRESWFETLMGKHKAGNSVAETDRESDRLPLPRLVQEHLRMNLGL